MTARNLEPVVQRKDDDVWRAIVDNYGERAELESDEPEPVRHGPGAASRRPEPAASWDDPYPDPTGATDRFVPPTPATAPDARPPTG